MRDDGYTTEEHDELVELINDLPREFYNNEDWEVTVSKLKDIVDVKESRNRK